MPDVKTNCFGFHPKTKECKIMTETICRKRKCSFYKTQKAYMEGLKKYPLREKAQR